MTPIDIARLAASPHAFRQSLVIDTDRGPRRWSDVVEPWQDRDFRALDPGWQRAMGMSVEGGFSRGYLERPRGHDKTASGAIMVAGAVAFSRRRLSGIAAAADREQAKLLRNAIARLVQLNPWLKALLDVQVYRVVNPHTQSELTILGSDVASSWGQTPDFVFCDELTHWRDSGLWESLFSASAKRGNCMTIVIANAGLGMGTSWQWQVREACREGSGWYFSRLDGPTASWITPERLDEQRRMLPTKAFNRLWLNLWTTDTGDAIDAADIEAACVLPGPMPALVADFEFAAGLDLGIKKDRAALVTVALDVVRERVMLARVKSWAPPRPGGEVDLADVERECLDLSRRYLLNAINFDPWQAAYLAQRLRWQGVVMTEWPFTTKNQDLMATTLLNAFRNGAIELYRDPALIRDLQRLTIVERVRGFRLEATRDKDGHADRATALAIILPSSLATIEARKREGYWNNFPGHYSVRA